MTLKRNFFILCFLLIGLFQSSAQSRFIKGSISFKSGETKEAIILEQIGNARFDKLYVKEEFEIITFSPNEVELFELENGRRYINHNAQFAEILITGKASLMEIQNGFLITKEQGDYIELKKTKSADKRLEIEKDLWKVQLQKFFKECSSINESFVKELDLKLSSLQLATELYNQCNNSVSTKVRDEIKRPVLINLEISLARNAFNYGSKVLKIEDSGVLVPSVGISFEKPFAEISKSRSFQTGFNFTSYSNQFASFDVLSGDSGNGPSFISNFFFEADFKAFSVPLNIKQYIPLKTASGYIQMGPNLNFISGFNLSAFEARADRATRNNITEFVTSIDIESSVSFGFNARLGLIKPVNNNYFGFFVEYKAISGLKLNKTIADLNDELYTEGTSFGRNEDIFKGLNTLAAGFSFSF